MAVVIVRGSAMIMVVRLERQQGFNQCCFNKHNSQVSCRVTPQLFDDEVGSRV